MIKWQQLQKLRGKRGTMNKYKDNFFKLSLQNLVLLGLVIAIKLCLSSVAIGPAFFKIGLAFLGSVALGYLFGPVWGGLGGLVSSLLHLIIFGDKANVLLGTMLSAILVPMIYGFFFYNKEVKIWRVVMGHLTVTILINIMLNNYLFSLVSGVSLQVAFIQRLPKEVILPWGQMILMYFVLKGLVPIRQRMISYEKSKNRIQEMEGETN